MKQLLLLYVCCISALFPEECLTYKVPNVDFKLLEGTGFEVSIPDEPGMQRVFYMVQVDDSCPAQMDYITTPTNNSWTSIQKLNLHNNDKVQISLLVQYNDEVYQKSETRVILRKRLLTTRNTSSRHISSILDENQCQAYIQTQQQIKPCKQAQSIVRNGQSTCQGELLFEDNFNEAEVNRSIWQHDVRHRMYHAEEELVAFDDALRNSYVWDGQLHIMPTIADQVFEGSYRLGDRCTAVDDPEQECNIAKGNFYSINPPVYSAQLHTRQSFSFKYGKIVVRAKLPKGDWLFPYIMLQPYSTHAETHFAKQLRIAYARGNAHLRTLNQEDISGKHLYGGMIVWHNGRAVQFLKDRLAKKHYGDDFHNYTMVWQPNKITLMVDDDIYGELYDGVSLFDEKCFIIFGVTVGGFLNFDDKILPEGVKPYKNQEPRAALTFWQQRDTWTSTWGKQSAMSIDYVRVYAE